MEQHPVPRNITGFQFHLIGDMTLKQFGELLGGCLLAYIIIRLPLPSLISWPIATLVALTGAAFAFVPIQERPLDRWLVAFIKSIYSPTQFLWQKRNDPPAILLQRLSIHKPSEKTTKHLSQMEESRRKLQAYIATLPKHPHEEIDNSETSKLNQTMAIFTQLNNVPGAPNQRTTQHASPITTSLPHEPESEMLRQTFPSALPSDSISDVKNNNAADKKIGNRFLDNVLESVDSQLVTPPARPPAPPAPQPTVIDEKIEEVKTELSSAQTTPARYHDLEQQLTMLAEEKERLASELVLLKRSMVDKQQPLSQTPPPPTRSTVKVIRPEEATKAGMPTIPQVPNMISGIIKDHQGNLLSNIIITVKDKDGIPQRALKTNRLGQFATSTPLTNGIYLTEMEDPQKKYIFDTINLNLTGALTTPIGILAKSERELQREKLMKEVFGT